MNSSNSPLHADSSWNPIIEGADAADIEHIAVDVAIRCLTSPLMQKSKLPNGDNSGFPPVHCAPSDTAGGVSGLSMLATYLHYCYPNQQWQTKSHTLLIQAAESLVRQPPNPRFYTGSTGVAFAVLYASENGQHYRGLQKRLDQYISLQVNAFLEMAQASKGIRVSQYDLISGAAGYAAYLLVRVASTSSDLTELCASVLRYLADITKPDSYGRICFIESVNIEYPERLSKYPQGYEDFGMAHGIAGIMAVLALAVLYGWKESWLSESLQGLSRWFVNQKFEDIYGTNWPAIYDPSDAKLTDTPSKNTRFSWCYGIPGKSRALYLAGKALNDVHLVSLALSTLESIQFRPRESWYVKSPNICHGLGGILQVYLRMFNDTKSPQLQPCITMLVKEITACYKTESLFGFQDTTEKGVKYNNSGLLNGASGVALSLLAAIESIPPNWDHFFLLS